MFKKLIKYLLKVIPNLFNILIFVKKRTKNVNYELVDKNIWIPFFTLMNILKIKKININCSTKLHLADVL